MPDMPANTGTGSRLKNHNITLWRAWYKREYGGAVNGVKGVAYALGPSFSVASCGVGSVDAVTLYAISPPVEPAVLKQVSIFPGAACPSFPHGLIYRCTHWL